MSRFFFHVRDSCGEVLDPDGLELADADQALREALKGARSIIAEGVCRGELDLTGSVEVLDEAGSTVLLLPYSEAVRMVG
jgi:hypothetical protein